MASNPTLDELRCDDCAFREGTEANRQQSTVLKAKLCAEAGEPFNCHRREGICAGWAQEINRLGVEFFRSDLPWKRQFRLEMIDIIDRIEHGEDLDFTDELKRIIEAVNPESERASQRSNPEVGHD